MNDSRESEVDALHLVVPDGIEPTRLDRFLANCSELSLTRSKIQSLIRNGEVLVNNGAAAVKLLVRGGEEITLTLPAAPVVQVVAEDIPIEILFEDDHLAVVRKPAGMVTHPAAGNSTGTLVNALLYRFGTLAHGGDKNRPGIVHRLDKNTSGLLIIARRDEAHQKLQEALQKREISRQYLGLIWGHLVEKSGRIDLPIGRSMRDRKKMAVTHQNSRPAVTDYEVSERFRSYDYLRLSLQTGRTHQIRVHLSHVGHPIFGDPEYDGREKRLGGMFGPERPLARKLLDILPRQALHATRLAFTHPMTGEEMSFDSEPPDDFQKVLNILAEQGG